MPGAPKTMRAVAIDRFDGPEALKIHELPVPEPDANEVLIAMHTAGVGSWDADMRAGWYPGDAPRFPLVLGTDAGHVRAPNALVQRPLRAVRRRPARASDNRTLKTPESPLCGPLFVPSENRCFIEARPCSVSRTF